MKKFLRYLGAGLLIVSALGGPALSAWTFNVPSHPDMAVGDILYVSSTTGQMTSLAAGASGQVLVGGGAGVAPSWSASFGTSGAAISAASLTGSGTGFFQGYKRQVVAAASGTTALTASDSGTTYVNTGTSSTTTFTLPTAAIGLHFCFIEGGDAGGELLVNPFSAASDVIHVKANQATDSTVVTTAANTGIKNTAATNAVNDMVCLIAVDTTNWRAYSQLGIWASQ